MAEIILTIAIEVVKCVARCFAPSAGRRLSYLREYKSHIEMLKTEVEKLKGKRTSVQRQVDAAKKKVEEVEENVLNWLEKAEEIEENVQKWLATASKNMPNEDAAAAAGSTREDEEETAGNAREDQQTAAKKRWLKVLSSGLKKRYQLGKEAVMQREAVVKHMDAGEFDQISHPIIPKDPRLCIKDFESFESRASTFRNVVSSLSDPDVNIVGIYGMGGIGKTTLAKQVANHLQENKLFDSTIFVEITENPDIIKIQKEIGERLLGLQLSQEDSLSTKAGKLYERLKKENNILIILDNIWDHLDLQAMGIPRRDEAKGCKLLLTARSVDVLSSKMNSQYNFPVSFLNDAEAWNLFEKMSGRDYTKDSELESVAREVANKCAHLPILIVTAARALSDKPLFMWKDFLQQMGRSSSKDVRGIHASIELSYKYLESEILQQTLLLIRYASLTTIDELLTYGMSLGLFDDIKEMEGRRARVQTLVQQLKDSCLLLDGHTTGKDFSMHDVVRYVILQIASRERLALTNEGVVEWEWEWPDENTLKAYPSIVLKDVKTSELPPVLECQQLKLLSISATGLYNCKLDDVAIIGYLKKLEILSLRDSIIKKLSTEVSCLIRLKSLDLRCPNLSFIPQNTISSLSDLEELYMKNFAWEKEQLNKARENASLNELKDLSKLRCLEIQIDDVDSLPRDLSFKMLERYKIAMGSNSMVSTWEQSDWTWSFTTPNSCRKLKLSRFNANICLKHGHIMQLKGIEDLCLIGLRDHMDSVVYGLDRDGFSQLKHLQVRDDDNFLCIVDSVEHVTPNVFPILESLLIGNLVNLEKICRSQVTAESSFSQLRKINVRECHKLDNIFSLFIARRLQLLESIDVIDCKNMKDIFAVEGDESKNIEVNDNIKLNQLRSLTLKSLPRFKSFYSKLKTPSTSQQRRDEVILQDDVSVSYTLFTEEVALPNLELLILYEINVQTIWQNQVAAVSSSVKNLTRLNLESCNNLRYLFSSSIARNLVRLQYLNIYKCQALEEIVAEDEGACIKFSSLKELIIWDCPKLKEFTAKNTSVNRLKEISLPFFNEKVALPNLEKLNLDACNSLQCLFSSSIVKSFVRLRCLEISTCSALEVIFDLEGANSEDKRSRIVSQLRELKLRGLPKLKHVWNKDCHKFLSFEQLKWVSITECDTLRNVFPMSIASNLSQLESLDIRKCGVENIVCFEDQGAETNNIRFLFPRVISLALYELPNFQMFCPGIYTTEWPELKKLGVNGLEMLLNILISNKERLPHILFEKVLPNLERLYIEKGEGIATTWQFPEDLICKLKYLQVKVDESSSFLSLDFLQRFHNMKLLDIVGPAIAFNPEVDENRMHTRIMNLDACSEFKHILKEESNMDHLIHLLVARCNNLINSLVPSSTSFRNLTTLTVLICHGLTSIVTCSAAKSLVQLRKMSIRSCDGLTEIVAADEGDETKDYEINFSQLKELDLFNLVRLTSFCSANCTLKFPSLEELNVEDCRKMKSFCGGEISTPKLQKVKLQNITTELRKGDLNKTIQELRDQIDAAFAEELRNYMLLREPVRFPPLRRLR
ncbi:Disease resistance protein [Melia azedarach]|uniref:Disease resistance protein n=1 Tax=Melia azedarach TaxID=155640 RepID=A0ACC1YCK0_MELAZ|nr:Disease resistance protein [Melia azedarach]